ncbi:MAG: hypothetical protein KDA86_19340 [Planctomycetaceae bacterium]|nr:hypothetical protein [Planctomycetaceae bacterium]
MNSADGGVRIVVSRTVGGATVVTYDKAFPAPMICDPPYEANHKVGSQLIGDDVTVTLLDSVPSTQDEEKTNFVSE